MEPVHLIVGLGNPGAEYARTRHNAGFLVAERLAERWGARWGDEPKFESRVAKAERGGKKVWLCEPLTFMNCSGEAVGGLVEYYKIPASQMVVVVDDADLKFGEIRLRASGSSGGHHGLESIETRLGTREYARLRVGIGRAAPGVREIRNYVLGKFAAEESEMLNQVLERSASQLERWLVAGLQRAMNEFNGAVATAPVTKEAK